MSTLLTDSPVDPPAWLHDLGYQLMRFRTLAISSLILAVLLPLAIGQLAGVEHGSNQRVAITSLVVSAAIVCALMVTKKLSSFPGSIDLIYISLIFAGTFSAAVVAALLAGLPIHGFYALVALLLSLLWCWGIYALSGRLRRPHFALVPKGDIDRVHRISDVRWSVLAAAHPTGERFDAIVADLNADLGHEWERFIADTAMRGRQVFHVKQMSERLLGRVEIEHMHENTLGSLNPDATYLKVKQLADWWLALAVGIVALPLLLLIGLAIRLDPGAALFRQERIGFRGRPFNIYKFRTMHVQQVEIGREEAQTRNADPRITRLGKFLRTSRIDELPQIVNILRGEMSWIGPRPEARVLSEWYEQEIPHYRYRHLVRPGISGWAQVSQGHVSAVEETLTKLHYDFYYVKNFSVWLDGTITLRTIRTMLTGFGAR